MWLNSREDLSEFNLKRVENLINYSKHWDNPNLSVDDEKKVVFAISQCICTDENDQNNSWFPPASKIVTAYLIFLKHSPEQKLNLSRLIKFFTKEVFPNTSLHKMIMQLREQPKKFSDPVWHQSFVKLTDEFINLPENQFSSLCMVAKLSLTNMQELLKTYSEREF